MDYIDLNGKVVKNTTSQDKLLKFLYTNLVGRMILKPLINKKLSIWTGNLLDTSFSSLLVKPFIKANNINMSDYEKIKYASFNDFFTRKVKPGYRPISVDTEALISPCDCKATVHPINDNSIFSIKNTEYTLRSLLKSPSLAKRFKGGTAYLLRLSVDDYHRYIYAVSGHASKEYHIDGTFHTVHPIANDYLPIYKENTREYTVIHTESDGDVVQMEVGALMVGKISNINHSKSVKRGMEKGFFEYGGSTIILLTQKGHYPPRSDLLENTKKGYETKILQGQKISL